MNHEVTGKLCEVMLETPPLQVLYVEDDPTLRALFAEFLGSAPSLDIAATAATADEAITLVRNETIDVALLDLALRQPESTPEGSVSDTQKRRKKKKAR